MFESAEVEITQVRPRCDSVQPEMQSRLRRSRRRDLCFSGRNSMWSCPTEFCGAFIIFVHHYHSASYALRVLGEYALGLMFGYPSS
jgi:hypothetical protein